MTLDPTLFVPILLMMFASLILIWGINWRWLMIAIILQYLGVFWLVFQNWSLGLSLVKVVVGLVSGGVLVSSLVTEKDDALHTERLGLIFKSLVMVFVWTIIYFILPSIELWLDIDRMVLLGAMVLVGSGLVQLGLTVIPIRTAIGLLTFLAGFEVLYSALISSVLLAGLLAAVNLGIALAGVYLGTINLRELD